MRYGIAHKIIKKNNDSPNINEYSARLSVYGDSKNKNNNALKFYPVFTYEYFVVKNEDIYIKKYY